MENYYSILGVSEAASTGDIKKAFREQAKHIHPDIAGSGAAEEMRRLLNAYEVLTDRERRSEYDRSYRRVKRKHDFDYGTFLRERANDNASCAKLVFFDLLHLEEDEAVSVWRKSGALEFKMEKYLDREDWMDCVFILAEELEKRGAYYEAVMLLVQLVREERLRPYFRHFMNDVELFLKEIVRLRLKASVDSEAYLECLESLLDLGFSPQDEARWMRSMAETLIRMGDMGSAERIFREALQRDPGLPNTVQLRRKLNIKR
jgi:tetratricopeptide (TPR) repeat protein